MKHGVPEIVRYISTAPMVLGDPDKEDGVTTTLQIVGVDDQGIQWAFTARLVVDETLGRFWTYGNYRKLEGQE